MKITHIQYKKLFSIVASIALVFTRLSSYAFSSGFLTPPAVDHRLVESLLVKASTRIALAQINVIVGDFEGNYHKIVDYINRAKERNVDIIVFPELVVTGYAPEDLLLKKHFIQDNIAVMHSLIEQTENITAIVGFVDQDAEGNLYNAAAIMSDGKLQGVYRKKDLPNYGVFDEKRYFKPGDQTNVIDLNGVTSAVNVCEDLWVDKNGIYIEQAEAGARLLINISASPFYTGRLQEREALLKKRVRQTNTFIAYANMVGGQDEVVFDGGSLIVGPDGEVVVQGVQFEEDLIIVDLNIKKPELNNKVISQKQPPLNELTEIETIYKALVLGTRDFIQKNGIEKVVVGLNGSVESCVVAAIAVEALGSKNVIGISMPIDDTWQTSHSESEKRRFAERLGISYTKIPVGDIYNAFLTTLNTVSSKQNLLDRIQATILTAEANKLGCDVLSTSNKTDLAIGKTAHYGDISGKFAPIQDAYRTVVVQLAVYINSIGQQIIPLGAIGKSVDSVRLPPGHSLDKILEAYLELNLSVEQMTSTWDRHTINEVISLVDNNEANRRKAPLGIKITRRNFGKDLRLPITRKKSLAPDVGKSM